MLRSFSLMVRSLDNLKAKVVSSWCGRFGFWKFFHILCLSAFVLEFFSWRESEVNLLQCEHISNQASLQEKRTSSTSLPRRAESERLRLSCYRVPVRQMCKCNYIGWVQGRLIHLREASMTRLSAQGIRSRAQTYQCRSHQTRHGEVLRHFLSSTCEQNRWTCSSIPNRSNLQL